MLEGAGRVRCGLASERASADLCQAGSHGQPKVHFQCACVALTFFSSYTPCLFKTSAAIGTVLLTGLEMISRLALGQDLQLRQDAGHCVIRFCRLSPPIIQQSIRQIPNTPSTRGSTGKSLFPTPTHTEHSKTHLAQASAKVATMDAFVLNRSSRVMPGLRGTPAGMTTTSAP